MVGEVVIFGGLLELRKLLHSSISFSVVTYDGIHYFGCDCQYCVLRAGVVM